MVITLSSKWLRSDCCLYACRFSLQFTRLVAQVPLLILLIFTRSLMDACYLCQNASWWSAVLLQPSLTSQENVHTFDHYIVAGGDGLWYQTVTVSSCSLETFTSTRVQHSFPVPSVTTLFWIINVACAVTSVINGPTLTVHEWMRTSTKSLMLMSTQNGLVLVVGGQRSSAPQRVIPQLGIRHMVLW